MNNFIDTFLSWEFLLVGMVIFCIIYYLNNRLGPVLWATKKPLFRKVLKFFELTKLVWPPLMGAFIGLIPNVPKPETIRLEPTYVVVAVYFVAGICCQWVVKGITKALEARGISIDLDEPPKTQMAKNKSDKIAGKK